MKTVLITGTSSGFGRLMVTAFLNKGYTVLATMRGLESRRAEFADEQKKFGTNLQLLELDLANEAQRLEVVEWIRQNAGGRLDVLINNAGYSLYGPFEESTDAQYRAQFEVNFFGTVFLTRGCLPFLRATKGKIINVSSIMGLTAVPLCTAYCSSKYALEGWGEALMHELKPHGVSVTMLEPGGFRTKFAQNSVAAEKMNSPKSPYSGQSRAYQNFRQKISSGKGNSPMPVIKAALKIAEMKAPPLRVRVGVDAKQMYFVSRLPSGLGIKILGTAYSKMLAEKTS